MREALQSIVALIEKSVKSKETRLQSGRLLRQTAVARRHLGAADLAAFVKANLPEDCAAKAYLLGVVDKVRMRPERRLAGAEALTRARCSRRRRLLLAHRDTEQQGEAGTPEAKCDDWL